MKTIKFIKKIIYKLSYYIKIIVNAIGLDITNNGERVYIKYQNINYAKMDIYQKTHLKRYEFARSLIDDDDQVGDMACGTGYGSLMLSEKAKYVYGFDINNNVIKKISKKYINIKNVKFVQTDILLISDNFNKTFNKIVSFETVEHVTERDAIKMFITFKRLLSENGKLIFSVPYKQIESKNAKKMGFHKIFNIDENLINKWLNYSGFKLIDMRYQNYNSFEIEMNLEKKDFIICTAEKI